MSNAPGTAPSSTEQSGTQSGTTTITGDSAAAYEAAQSILKAINFGDLLKLPPEEDEAKEGASQSQAVGNGVEHLLSHVQAVLACRNAEEAATTTGSIPSMVAETTPTILPSPSLQVPENQRAELQAQLALLSAQLAEFAQIEEPQVAGDPTVSVSSLAGPPMHSLTPDEPSSLSQPLTSMTPLSEPGDHASSQSEPESDDDDMEAVI